MCLQNIYQIYILNLLWFTTLTPQKEFHDSMTILYQYNPDVSFHKDSLFTYPWNFSFGQQTMLTSNRNMPCVYIDRCVCTYIYIYIQTYMHPHSVTNTDIHRHWQSPGKFLLFVSLSSPQFQEFSAANIFLSTW